MTATLLAVALGVGLAQAAPGAAPEPATCAAEPEFALLDSWVGTWDVFVGPTKVGENEIREVRSGCAIERLPGGGVRFQGEIVESPEGPNEVRHLHRGASTETRHLIYLHGRIVQTEQSRRPVSPQFGPYELDLILDTFRGRGFEVHSEMRPASATVSESADRVVEQVRALLATGARPESITVVGASMGASIGLRAAARLQNPAVRFALLGACLAPNVREVETEERRPPIGRVLAIREASDDLGGTCPAWPAEIARVPGLVGREIVLETGLAHGFLYRPLPEWVEPVVAWAATGGGGP